VAPRPGPAVARLPERKKKTELQVPRVVFSNLVMPMISATSTETPQRMWMTPKQVATVT
jgi:hypothetical protein